MKKNILSLALITIISLTGSKKETTTEDDGSSNTEVLGKQFEENKNPQTYLSLYGGVIRGWSEIFPRFKAGTYVGNPDGTISYSDFGAGIMFLPSGLGYYNNVAGSIPSYSNLIFTFKFLNCIDKYNSYYTIYKLCNSHFGSGKTF